jgi:hypothetical protein
LLKLLVIKQWWWYWPNKPVFLNSIICTFMVEVHAPLFPAALVLVLMSNIDDERKDIFCSLAILIGVIFSVFQ